MLHEIVYEVDGGFACAEDEYLFHICFVLRKFIILLQSMPKAIIYDMDGLLIDSEPYWRKAMMKVLGDVGLHLTDEQCAMTTGLRFDHVLEYWFEKYPW